MLETIIMAIILFNAPIEEVELYEFDVGTFQFSSNPSSWSAPNPNIDYSVERVGRLVCGLKVGNGCAVIRCVHNETTFSCIDFIERETGMELFR